MEGQHKNFPQSKFAIGSVWNGFEILQELGRGGMGIVYKAMQHTPRRLVALKILLTQKISARQRTRFLKEIQLSSQLTHPHIVKVYAAEISQDVPYVVMEYIAGMSLRQYLQIKTPSISELLQIITTVASALSYTHKKGIIHRDLKPENILIAENGTPYLMDFGLARSMRIEDRSLTKTGEILGTPQYMAPEQVKQSPRRVDQRIDVYALGAILYEITTGKQAITGNSPMAILFNVVSEKPIPPRALNPKMPNALEAIILKAMAYDKRDRYASAGELNDDLQRLLKNKPVRATIHHELYWKIIRFYSSIKWLIYSALLISIAMGLWAGWLYRQSPWQKKLDIVKTTFERRNYAQALEQLNDLHNCPYPQKIQSIRDKIYKGLQKQAYKAYKANKYNIALQSLALIIPPNAPTLKLKIDILARQQHKGMRLALAELAQLDPSIEYWLFIAEKALTRGYFSEASQYVDQAKKKSLPESVVHAPRLQKITARILLFQGKIDLAYKQYKNLLKHQQQACDSEVYLGLAAINYQKKQYRQALQNLAKMDSNCSPYLLAQKLFLRARILWEQQQNSLNNYHWLFSHGHKNENLHKQLLQVAKFLQRARTSIRNCVPNYLSKRLAVEIQLTDQALTLERTLFPSEIHDSKLRKFRQQLQQANLSHRSQIFFAEIMMRSLMRHNKNKQAHKLSSEKIHRYPWTSQLYLLRAMNSFASQKLRSIIDDMLKLLQLVRWNTSLGSITDLFLQRFTHYEFYTYYRLLVRYAFYEAFEFERHIFAKDLQQLTRRYIFSEQKYAFAKDIPWQDYFQIALAKNTSASQKFAIEVLARHYEHPDFQVQLRQMQSIELDNLQKKSLQLLYAAVRSHKQRAEIGTIRQILLRYSTFAEDRYSEQIQKMGKKGSDLVTAIFEDKNELLLMRLLAARMLTALCDKHLLFKLEKIAGEDDYPKNLLAAVALRKAGIPCPLPANIPLDKNSLTDGKQSLCMILLALHLHPQLDKSLLKKLAADLLSSTNETVALCAVYNLRRYSQLPVRLLQAVERRLKSLCSEKAELGTRALALQVLWRVEDLFQDIPYHRQRHAAVHKYIHRVCLQDRERHRHLLKFLDNESPKILKLAALQSIISDNWLRRQFAFAKQKHVLKKIVRKLQTIYRNAANLSELSLKQACAIAIAIVGQDGEVCDIIEDSQVPCIIRVAAVMGIMAKTRPNTSEFIRLMQLQQRSPQDLSLSDRQLLQILTPTLEWWMRHGGQTVHQSQLTKVKVFIRSLLGSRKKQLLTMLNHMDDRMQRTAITAFLWSQDKNGILYQKILPFLQETDVDTQRAAAATLASLALRYHPQQLPKLQRVLQKCSLPVRRAAALGYCDDISYSHIYNPQSAGNSSAEEEYDLYLEVFRTKIANASPTDLRNWMKAINMAIKIAPSIRWHYIKALLLCGRKKFRQAHMELNTALRIVDRQAAETLYSEVRCLNLLGEIYLQHEKFPQARKYLSTALEKIPFYPKTNKLLAEIFCETNEIEKARQHLWRAYLYDTSNPRMLFLLGETYLAECAIKDALNLKNYTSTIWKTFATTRRLLEDNVVLQRSNSLLQKHKYNRAYRLTTKVLRNSPFDPRVHIHQANVCSYLGKTVQGRKHLLYAYLCSPAKEIPEVLVRLAANFLKDNNKTASVQILQYLHQHFSLRRSTITSHSQLKVLSSDPWVRSLAK